MGIDDIASLCQIIGTCAVVIALFIGLQQIIEHKKQKQLEYIWNMFNELDDNDTHQARNNLYKHSHYFIKPEAELEDALNDIPKDLLDQAALVSSSFDRIGYFVHHKLIPQNLILDNFAYSLARSWIILENYINVLRKTKYHKDHECFFEMLARSALAKYITEDDIHSQLVSWNSEL